ncbi:MAG TPA: thioredoxin domain-containing protein [Burkholderiales bacterium]|jgi:hypothetical protein|nr:thioredoxin domain-containing protein [Burkholderiales bacterium]
MASYPSFLLIRNIRDVLVAVAIGVFGAGSVASAEEKNAAERHANRLIDSNNPYLLLHARNPVDWYPWGPEALEKAKRENKPIFLSVGYSTCYWCHVAEQTIYRKQEFADKMNAWFVNIKVDREQRPDIDRLYLAATQAITGRGGWPNNVFLTPDLEPFYAGSYFAPHDDAFGRPGFDTVLKSIHEAWTQDPMRVRATAQKVTAALRQRQQESDTTSEPIDPHASLNQAVAAWAKRADARHGGFGPAQGPRFPQEPVLALLITAQRVDPAPAHIGVLTRALDAMATGGTYDQLAGGFHRYATEATWSIPHFEKMLYDNAQLLPIYAEAYRLTGEAYYRMIATGTADYLMTRMMAPDGGFYTAEDAAVNGKEGGSYLWTRQEIAFVLGGEAASFFDAYALTPMPDEEGLQTAEQTLNGETLGVLRVRLPIEETIERTGHKGELQSMTASAPMRRTLLEVRDRRAQPARDEKLVVALNGLAIQAFARTGQLLDMPLYIDVARRSAERIWRLAYDRKSGLRHEVFNNRAQTEAFLDDYALLGLSYLALYGATRDAMWNQRATELADRMLARFQRSDGTLATTLAEKELPLPPEESDNAYASGTSAAVDLLLQLARSTGAARYADGARRIVGRLGHRIAVEPESWPALITALNRSDFSPSLAKGLSGTAAVVRVAAVARSGADQDEIMVTLHIEDGYHVNANPATYDYLMATSVVFDGLTPTRVRYPVATLFKPAFAPAGLKVYEGEVTLVASFPKGTAGKAREIRAVVSAQACDSEICLLPAQLPVTARR